MCKWADAATLFSCCWKNVSGDVAMPLMSLGRLETVDLRDIWTTEATDFTPWLARSENLAVLGKTLGIELELEAQERAVGPFRADLLCKDIGTGRWVLIENQLERTDHVHLGQLLTYASGLEAVTIVWIGTRPFFLKVQANQPGFLVRRRSASHEEAGRSHMTIFVVATVGSTLLASVKESPDRIVVQGRCSSSAQARLR